MKKVSVIIPVYNGQRTIGRCLKSVKGQSYSDVEIIVVNDGSSDRSASLIDKSLNDFDDKVIVHQKRNEGVEMARKTGICASHGVYITFVDADDYLEKDAIERMVKAIELYNADLIQCRSRTFFSLGKYLTIHPFCSKNYREGRLISKDDIMTKEILSFFGCGSFSVTVWGKLYKKEFLDNIRTAGLVFGEDLYLNMQIFPKLKTIYVLPDALYHYERQGVTSKFMPNFMEDTKLLYHLKLEEAKEIQSDKAFLYSTIELRNCLKTYVESMILHKVDSPKGIKERIKQELQDNTYHVFYWLRNQKQSGHSDISLAIMNKDIDAIYDLCRKSVYEWKWKKIARRILIKLS